MASPTQSDFKSDSEQPSATERAKQAASDVSKQTTDAASKAADTAKDTAAAAVATLKEQAGQAADEAKTTVSAVADEAKARLSQIVDDQKALGADHVAGLARAAYSAAGDLRQTSPQLARLMESAAGRVDDIADDIRSQSLGDILSTLSAFGRRQPVALFGGAVVAGFLLARFVKSGSGADVHSPVSRDPRRV